MPLPSSNAPEAAMGLEAGTETAGRMVGLKTIFQTCAAEAKIPFALAMVADRRGLVFVDVFNAPNAPPIDRNTLFWLASMTKPVTSVAALQLVEQGLLSLDAPLHPLIPEFESLRVLEGFGEDGVARTRPARGAVTLRHLLTHTAGFAYDFANADILRSRGKAGSGHPGRRASMTGPLIFDPGEGWEYGVSTDWVGLTVEAASGQSLGAYLDAHIFEPLGMTDTHFVVPPAKQPRAARQHARTDSGDFVEIPSLVGDAASWAFQSGGGGLWGTAGDYIRFLRMILNDGMLDGARVIGPGSVRLLSENQVGDLRAGRMNCVVPSMNGVFDLFPEMRTGWSLGFLINPEPSPQRRSAGSLAWAGLSNTHFWIDPAEGVCAVLMTQLLPFADPKVLTLLAAFEHGVYAAGSDISD